MTSRVWLSASLIPTVLATACVMTAAAAAAVVVVVVGLTSSDSSALNDVAGKGEGYMEGVEGGIWARGGEATFGAGTLGRGGAETASGAAAAATRSAARSISGGGEWWGGERGEVIRCSNYRGD